MKKALVVLSCLVVIGFMGCGYNPDYHIIAENRSSFPVTFSISNGYGEETLDPNEKKQIALKAGVNTNSTLEYYTPEMKVDGYYSKLHGNVTFTPRKSYQVKVTNFTNTAGALNDKSGFMEINPLSFDSAMDSVHQTCYIYTSKPIFSATIGEGIIAPVKYSIVGDDCLVSIWE